MNGRTAAVAVLTALGLIAVPVIVHSQGLSDGTTSNAPAGGSQGTMEQPVQPAEQTRAVIKASDFNPDKGTKAVRASDQDVDRETKAVKEANNAADRGTRSLKGSEDDKGTNAVNTTTPTTTTQPSVLMR